MIMTLASLTALAGLLLGLRYRVLVLIPTSMLVLLVSIACGLAWGASLATATLSIITVIVTLQLGYLSGAAMRLFAVKGQPQLSTQGLPVEGL